MTRKRVSAGGDTPARIAELEAELAAYRSELGRSMKGENEQRVRAETAEAEVERLKTDLIWWALHASSVHRCDHNIEGGGRESGVAENPSPDGGAGVQTGQAAAEPAAPSLSARKATRKTDSCDGTTHTVVHADGNVCPFLVPRSP